MSSLLVEIVEIDDIQKHPNADKLDVATVKGWFCIVGRGQFQKGDKCLYIPIDSVLPEDLVNKLFKDSKIRPVRGRIRTVKIRGQVSQGLVVRLEDAGLDGHKVGENVADLLKIAKYEPPVQMSPASNAHATSKKQTNSNFRKYTEIENFKNHVNVFEEGEQVSITEKIHGSNFRCGYVKTEVNTLWKKIKKLFGKLPEFEFVYGSHNVQLQDLSRPRPAYYSELKKNIYWEAIEKYDLRSKLKDLEDEIGSVVVYGEVYGDGIQKGYTYGHKTGERSLVVFDVMVDGRYLDVHEMKSFCKLFNLPTAPELYQGPFDKATAKSLTEGCSVLEPTQKIREGIVIKPLHEENCPSVGRKVLKWVSDEYLLLKENSDWH